jgi:hypothetical protein
MKLQAAGGIQARLARLGILEGTRYDSQGALVLVQQNVLSRYRRAAPPALDESSVIGEARI